MKKENKVLSDIVVFSKYARYVPEIGRRETWEEIVQRNMAMHIRKFPALKEQIRTVYNEYVIPKKVLPSMRSLQFGGRPIEISPNRIYNCFSPDTEVQTVEYGLVKLEDIEGQEVTVINAKGEYVKGLCKYFGDGLVRTAVFVNGRQKVKVDVTDNHRWWLTNGDRVTTDALVPPKNGKCGSHIPYVKVNGETEGSLEGFLHGMIYADGTVTKNKDRKYYQIRLCGKKAAYLETLIKHFNFKYSFPPSFEGDPIVYAGSVSKYSQDLKQLPNTNDAEYIKGFLNGAIEFDGTCGKESYVDYLIKWGHLVGVNITSKHKFSGTTNFGERKQEVWKGVVRGNADYVFSGFEGEYKKSKLLCLVVPEHEQFTLKCGLLTSNCCFLHMDSADAFSELMFLLLGGTGVGYSVQKQHVDKLPVVVGTKKRARRFVVGDSIEGWADAVKVLVKSYFFNQDKVTFDFSDIREKGAKLVTSGGKAPGPQPLKDCIHNLTKVLDGNLGRKLSPINVHDMCCYIADAVLAGGIRRAALISLFSRDDENMLTSKTGPWWELNPQRGRANNSVVLPRGEVSKEEFDAIWKRVEASGAGEPGVTWTNNDDWGMNP